MDSSCPEHSRTTTSCCKSRKLDYSFSMLNLRSGSMRPILRLKNSHRACDNCFPGYDSLPLTFLRLKPFLSILDHHLLRLIPSIPLSVSQWFHQNFFHHRLEHYPLVKLNHFPYWSLSITCAYALGLLPARFIRNKVIMVKHDLRQLFYWNLSFSAIKMVIFDSIRPTESISSIRVDILAIKHLLVCKNAFNVTFMTWRGCFVNRYCFCNKETASEDTIMYVATVDDSRLPYQLFAPTENDLHPIPAVVSVILQLYLIKGKIKLACPQHGQYLLLYCPKRIYLRRYCSQTVYHYFTEYDNHHVHECHLYDTFVIGNSDFRYSVTLCKHLRIIDCSKLYVNKNDYLIHNLVANIDYDHMTTSFYDHWETPYSLHNVSFVSEGTHVNPVKTVVCGLNYYGRTGGDAPAGCELMCDHNYNPITTKRYLDYIASDQSFVSFETGWD